MTDHLVPDGDSLVAPDVQLPALLGGPGYSKFGRFVIAAMGSIPWIGGVIAASAAMHGEAEQANVNALAHQWLEEHQKKIRDLQHTLAQMMARLTELGEQADQRLQDGRYLALVRQGFRTWDHANTQEKRERVRRTLTNAGSTRQCSDDVVRLFLDWIELYDEAHFQVIRVIYRNSGVTRADIWHAIHGDAVPENSAEADLFKLLIRDLSTGSVIRQHRDTDGLGNFLPKARAPKARSQGHFGSRRTIKSAFDDQEPYELTELGGQFVHYAMNEPAPRLAGMDGG